MASVGEVLDGVRYSLTGFLFGTGAGTLTEMVADEVVDALDLEAGGNHTSKPFTTVIAEGMIRTTFYSVGLVLSARLYHQMSGRGADPTDAAMYAYAYSTSQDNLYHALVDLGTLLKKQLLGEKGGPCCSGCASGGSCAGDAKVHHHY